jgi:F420-dependent oxidoreductase-like protein
MQIAMPLAYAGGFEESVRLVTDLESAGLDLVWVAEAYGFDGVSLMGYLAAKTDTVRIGAGILPLYTRTPALLAMTAAGLDSLSGGRFELGLGASGPQVIEGFHGVAYDKPLGRTREIIDICRKVWAREAPLVHDGPLYQVPLPAGQGTGLGKPLKILAKPIRPRIPVHVAALGEKNVELTAEISDGWLPVFFLPERAKEVFGPSLDAGAAKRDSSLEPLQIFAGGLAAVGEWDDVRGVLDMFARPLAALYIGGMGARGRNFYNALVSRYGYEAEAKEVQDLYLAGKKDEAAAAIPTEFLELTNLVGPPGFVQERIAAFREAGVTTLNINPVAADPAKLLEQIKGWAA